MKGKKTLIWLAVSILMTGTLQSCQPKNDGEPDEATITVSSNTLTLDAAETKAVAPQISVTTNYQNWDVSDNAEWLSAIRQGDGIAISTERNASGRERTADVLVFAGSVMKKVIVTQSAADIILEVSPVDFNIAPAGGKFMIDVNTNTSDWTAELDGQPEWISYRKVAGGQMIELTVAENSTAANRQTKMYIVGGGVQKEVNIIQATSVLGNNILPLLKSMALSNEILKFEENRGSSLVKYDGGLPEHFLYKQDFRFLTTSPIFHMVRYERTQDDGRLNTAILETNKISYVTSDDFKNYLVSEGFEILTWDASAKKIEADNKELQYKMSVEFFPDNLGGRVKFVYYPVQKVAYPTFAQFPYYNANMLNKKTYAEINEWELAQGSTFVKTIPSKNFPNEIGAAMYMNVASKSPLFSTFYHFWWEKDMATGLISEIWFSHNRVDLVYWDSSENGVGKWVLTNEFKALLEGEGFSLIGYTEDDWPGYAQIEKNLIFFPIVAKYKDLNAGKPVLELVYTQLDPTMASALKTQAGRASILKRYAPKGK